MVLYLLKANHGFAARIEISSELNVLEIAQEREDIKVTNSHGFKIITPLSVYDDCGGK